MEYLSPTIQPLHPVIYATATVLLLCLVTVITTYMYHHRYPRVLTVNPLTTNIRNHHFCIQFQVCPSEPQILAHADQPLLPHLPHIRHLRRRHQSDEAGGRLSGGERARLFPGLL